MNENPDSALQRLLALDPYAHDVLLFEQSVSQEEHKRIAWHDFLAEKYLDGELNARWRMYVEQSPGILQVVDFLRDVQHVMRSLHTDQLRTEVQTYLPRRPVGRGMSPPKRLLLFVVSTAAVALLLGGFLLYSIWSSKEDPATRLIASPYLLMVEPFALEGVSEEMIVHGIPQRVPAKLSATEGIHPITFYAVSQATQRMTSTPASQTVNAQYTVRGSVTRNGTSLAVHAELYDLMNSRSIWNSVYTVSDDPAAFDDMQVALSMDVARALNVDVHENAVGRLSRHISDDILAVELFMAGERLWAERSRESLAESIEKFEMALLRDSASTMIRGYLALALATYADNGYGDSTHWVRAKTAAERTLLSDPFNPESLVALGDYAEFVEKDYAKAARLFAQALEEQPGDAKIHQAIAELHIRTGQFNTGLEHLLTARRLEPEHRVVRWVETKYLTASGRLEDARLAAEDLMNMDPKYFHIKNFYWQYHLSRGELDLALETIPTASSDYAKNYMRGMVYIHAENFDALASLDQYDFEETFRLLEFVQNDAWTDVYITLRSLLATHRFDLLPMFQTSDFALFNKMKEDSGVVRILEEYGITVHKIPVYESVM